MLQWMAVIEVHITFATSGKQFSVKLAWTSLHGLKLCLLYSCARIHYTVGKISVFSEISYEKISDESGRGFHLIV